MDTETPTTDAPAEEILEDAPELGDAGKQALQTERKARRDAEKALKAIQSELEAAREAQLSEAEKAISQARREARDEALREVNARVIRAEAKALATGKLADPSDISSFIDLNTFEVDDEGNVDTKAIAKAIDELIKQKPYLAAQRVGGDADAGARGAAPTPRGSMNDRIRRAAGVA
jgi:ElaB/YqjD/DUF883 family membrane-anchored ribosome-binding protein